MGEVRKRKTSGEKNGANGAAEAAPVVQKRFGLVKTRTFLFFQKLINSYQITQEQTVEKKRTVRSSNTISKH